MVLIAINNLLFKIALDEYNGTYNLEIQVLADGRWESSAGRIVTDGIGWNPSSEAGSAGDPEILHFRTIKCWIHSRGYDIFCNVE